MSAKSNGSAAEAIKPESQASGKQKSMSSFELELAKKRLQDEEKKVADHPVLQKIRGLLSQAKPDKWRSGGEELNTKAKYPRHLDTWEQVLAIDMADGILVLRSSLPVKCEYLVGGYTLTPVALENYTVEMRAKGWNLRELVDPYYRNTGRKDKRCDVLLEGSMAGVLYREIRTLVESFIRERKRSFEEECMDLVRRLPDVIPTTKAESWERVIEKNALRFAGTVENIQIEVSKTTTDGKDHYDAKLCREELTSKNTVINNMAKDLFDKIDSLGKNAKLNELSKLLEGAGF